MQRRDLLTMAGAALALSATRDALAQTAAAAGARDAKVVRVYTTSDGGSRVEGPIAEIVFLGMYTQFHVDTGAGRLVAHRLADESLEPLEPGARVALTWEPDQASLLGS